MPRLGLKETRPPRLAERLIAWRTASDFREFALGDLAQEHDEQCARRGRMAARCWYRWQTVRMVVGGREPDRVRPPRPERRKRRGLTETVGRDVMRALRSFARSPLFTAAAVVTLALGIGATTAAFSLADAVLLRPIPGIAAPDDVANLVACYRDPERPDSCPMAGLSYPNLRDVASRLRSASGIGGEVGASSEEIVVGDGPPLTLSPTDVSDSYFEVLGMRPHLGRTFTREEDDPALGAPVAVISYRLWTTLFHRSPGALGAEILVNGKPFTIIGVAERGFQGTRRGGRDDLWLPGGTMLWVKEWEGDMSDRGTVRDFNYMVVRRNAAVSWEQVEGELDSFTDWLAEQYPEANAKFRDIDFRVRPDVGAVPRQAVTVMAAVMAVVGLILLIACANVSTLLLIQGIRRQGEVAVRKALGASTARLIGEHLTESVTLWMLGGAAGTALALLIIRVVDRTVPQLAGQMWLDARVLTFVAGLSLTVGIAFGALPALAVSRVHPARWLGQGTGTVTGGRGRVRAVMTAVQLAATLTLLVGALLTNRTLGELAAIDLGFEPRGVTVFDASPGRTRYDASGRVEYYRALLRGLRADPSIEDAGMALMAPFLSGGVHADVRVAGSEAAATEVLSAPVGPRFFETLGIRLRAGRTFTDDEALDLARDNPVVLGASTARRLFGDADPLGELVVFEHEGAGGPRHRVIGVVNDIRFAPSSLTTDVDAVVYEPLAIGGDISGTMTFLVRRRAGSANIGAVIRATATSVDDSTRVIRLQPHEDAVTRFYGSTTLLARLSVATGLLAAILAAVGLYGVVGVAADARMREFGIRLALGAAPRTLFGVVVREAAGVVLAGLLLGAAGSFALGTVIESFLYGVTPLDPLSWALAGLFLAVVAALAIIAPARRATTLDPVEVLRAG